LAHKTQVEFRSHFWGKKCVLWAGKYGNYKLSNMPWHKNNFFVVPMRSARTTYARSPFSHVLVKFKCSVLEW